MKNTAQLKIVVISFSGNMGKTTLSANLLSPRMADAQIFSVESLNVDSSADGLDVEKVRGKQYNDLMTILMQRDAAIIDVGASNVEEFLKQMQQYSGSHEEFDYFLVPTIKEKKQQADTVNTLRALAALGIPKNKIRLVFNKVDSDDSVLDDFASLFGLAELEKGFVINEKAIVYSSPLYDQMKTVGKSLADITSDDTDYRARMRVTESQEEKEHCINMVAMKRLSVNANKNLDDVFKALFK